MMAPAWVFANCPTEARSSKTSSRALRVRRHTKVPSPSALKADTFVQLTSVRFSAFPTTIPFSLPRVVAQLSLPLSSSTYSLTDDSSMLKWALSTKVRRWTML